MTSIKVKFRASTVDGREGTIYYQIIHERNVRQLASAYRIFPAEWNGRQVVATPHSSARRGLISKVREGIRLDVERIRHICRRMEEDGTPYTADDVAEEFASLIRNYSLFNHMNRIIAKLRLNGQERSAKTYTSALSSFRQFRSNTDIMLDCITSDMMEAYEAWLRLRGATPNTVSFYMRILRAAYNRAVDTGAIDDRRPFRRVYTGVDKTVKRALPLSIIKRIKALPLSDNPALDFARDMFMISFYLRGMSFIDMAYLNKSDLRGGYVTYCRRKTGQRLTIAWTADMQRIVDKYPANRTDHLLPIITTPGDDERSAYLGASYRINRSLKQLAKHLGLSSPLTMYVARHSWASAAQAKGVPLGIISEGMGHDSESTTRIYLAGLDTTAVDRANALILDSLQ